MWPFRRRGEADAEGSAPSSAEAASTGAPGPPVPRSPEAWRTMAPLQRTIGEAPHTYRTDDIGEILSSWNSPRLSGELGHQVSADAPGGVLHGMATTVEASPVGSLQLSSETSTLRELSRHHDHDTDEGARTGAVRELLAPGADAIDPPAGQPTHTMEPAGPAERGVAAAAAPLRTLSASAAPVPTVSRITAPEVVAPRALPALLLPLQRATEPGASSTAAPASTSQGAPGPPSPISAPVPTAAPAEDAPLTSSDSLSDPPSGVDRGADAPLTPATPLVVPPPERDAGPGAPSLPPGAILGPPIQPRSIQRRAVDLPLPPVPRQPDTATPISTGPSSTTAGAAHNASSPATAAKSSPAEGPADAATPTANPGDPDPTTTAPPDPAPTTATPPDDAAAPLTGQATPLVQRSAAPGHSLGDGHDHGDGDGDAIDAAGDADDGGTGPAMPLQRQQAAPPDRAGPDSAVAKPIGLGQPLVDLPAAPSPAAGEDALTPDAPAAPSAAPPGLPLAGPPTVQRSASEGTPAGTVSPGTPASPASAQPTAPAPPATEHGTTTTGADSAEHDTGATEQQPMAADPVAALLGDRLPIVDADEPAASRVDVPAGVDRSSEPGAPELPLAGAVPPPAPLMVSTLQGAPLVLQRSLDEGPPTILGAHAGGLPSPVPATRASTPAPSGTLRAASAGPVAQRTTLSTSSMPGRPPTAVLPGLTQSLQPRSLTLASPAPAPAVPASWTDAGDLAVANGVAQRMLDGSVQFNAPPSVGAAARSGPSGSNATSDHSSQQPAITGSATSAPEAPPKKGNEREELEDQARKLWPLLRRKLTNELLSGPKGRQAGW